ncbi:unnamed protein product [Rotaria sp. Silwood1]|nr:unnamed protein product [Rotaria sp. Silwood1]
MSKSFRLSSSEKIEAVKWYAIYQHASEVARQFQNHFNRTSPTPKDILSLVQKFDEIGSVADKPRSDRLRSVSTDNNRERVRASFEENSGNSARRASLELSLLRSSLR